MTEEEMYPYDNNGGGNDAIKGYRIVIIILTVILAALSFQYFRQVNILRGSEEVLKIERDTLQNRLGVLMNDFDNIKTENDTINQQLTTERQRADSLFDRLKKERNWSYAKIKKYEKELGTMRTIMTGYIKTIDSLNVVNNKLSSENIKIKKDLASARNRANVAEEQVQEAQSKIRTGSIILARNIDLKALNANDKVVTKARRSSRLRVDLVLSANQLAVPGEREIYARITGPDGFILTESPNALFEFEGEKLSYSCMRANVDYANEDLAVGIYYNGSNITEGKYIVDLYMDGRKIGSNEIILK